MAQTKKEIQAILESIDASPRHRFGQNFMIDQNLLRCVVDAGDVSSDDVVIEVGPGTGTLTEELLSRAGRVIAVEIDRDLAQLLRGRFADRANFELIEGDALASKHEVNAALLSACRLSGKPGVKLVANLPYNIASPLVIELLVAKVDLLAFTVQREVADRLRARENDDAYGPLSVMASMLSRVEVLRTLPPQAFWPAPKIESALVRMVRNDRTDGASRAFSTFVHGLFSFRRKTMRKALSQMNLDADALIQSQGIDPKARPETIAPEILFELFKQTRPEASRGCGA